MACWQLPLKSQLVSRGCQISSSVKELGISDQLYCFKLGSNTSFSKDQNMHEQSRSSILPIC